MKQGKIWQHRYLLILVLILILGTSLRIYNLGEESFWLDEITSIRVAQENIPTLITNRAQHNHVPLYFILLKFWTNFVKQNEFWIRFLSSFFGIFSIILLYLIGVELFNPRVGLLSSFLLSISPFHIWYSQEARMYSLTGFLSLLAVYFLVKIIFNPAEKKSHYLGYIFSTTALIYTHYYGLLVLLFMNIFFLIYFFFFRRLKIKKWFFSNFVIVLFYSPWVSILVSQFIKSTQVSNWRPQPSLGGLLNIFVGFVDRKILLVCYCVLIIIAFINLPANPLKRRGLKWKIPLDYSLLPKNLLLLLWVLIPLLFSYVVSLLFTPILILRYLLPVSFPFYLFFAQGCFKINRKFITLFLIILVIILILPRLRDNYFYLQKPDYKGAIQYFDEKFQKGDLVLFTNIYWSSPFNYYSQKDYSLRPLAGDIPLSNRLWLIIARGRDDELIDNQLSNYSLISEANFNMVIIRLYQKENSVN